MFFIRVAATNLHDFFAQAHETLQDVVIADSLDVAQILVDFVPPAASMPDNLISDLLKLIAPEFSISDKVVKQNKALGPQADASGIVGALFGFAASLVSLSDLGTPQISLQNLTAVVDNALSGMFTNTNNNITTQNAAIFGSGSDEVDLEQVLAQSQGLTGEPSRPSLQPITQSFANGDFLPPLDQSALMGGITAGFNLIKQQLVGIVLAAQNYFVFVDNDRTISLESSVSLDSVIYGFKIVCLY